METNIVNLESVFLWQCLYVLRYSIWCSIDEKVKQHWGWVEKKHCLYKKHVAWDQHVFIGQSLEILNDFNILTLKQIFRKMKSFSKNWSTVPELEALRLKTHYVRTKLEKNFKTNRMGNTKLTYHKERSFSSN